MLAFFGLTPEYRSILFKQIHEVVFHGKGGYDWDTVYSMPVWLRRTTFNLMKEYYDKEAEEYEKSSKGQTSNAGEIARPNIPQPTYVSKAPKK